jgi:hypothetical protein
MAYERRERRNRNREMLVIALSAKVFIQVYTLSDTKLGKRRFS